RDLDAVTLQQTVRCLRADPPLLIFTAASFCRDGAFPADSSCFDDPSVLDDSSVSCDSMSLSGLATWLAQHAAALFADGDAFLAAPEICSQTRARWSELDAYFQTIPPERWLDEAALWLEVCGPAVPSAWRAQWAKVAVRDETDQAAAVAQTTLDPSSPGGFSLLRLALQVQHTGVLELSFDQRLQQQKLASLKQLAYGLSHEINNPLANISTRAQQLQQGEADPQRGASLQKIVDQVYRAHEMIADLMFYANPTVPAIAQCDLVQLVVSIAEEFAAELESLAIRLQTEVPAQPMISLPVDATMIGEALRVLVRNSIEAIGSDGAIVISIETEPDRVRIQVADSGPGVSPSARAHAFDPFFSGREAGRGLGLGLCRAYRVVELHGGEITLSSGPGGCVATISLPPR
ncbi:MAG: sensor histidine kinase, partial [Novipirellula sp. JB048]